MVPRSRMDELIRKYLDRTASEAEQAELGDLLAESPEAADRFAEASRMDCWIANLLKEEQSLRRETEFIQGIERRCSEAGSRPSWMRAASWKVWAGMAAAVLIASGLSFWLLKPGPTAASAIAHLVEVRGEAYVGAPENQTLARPGQELFSGQGLQTVGEDSSVAVVYPDGTRLEFAGDTTVSELSGSHEAGKRIVLSEGCLTADVTKQPPDQPMRLLTPHAEVVVRGTRFNLSNGTEATYLETESGLVQLTRKCDGQSVQVPAGFDTVITNREEPLAAQPLPPRYQTPRLTLQGYWTGALSPDGKTLAASRFLGGIVELWDVATRQPQATLHGHTKRVCAVAFSPDGQTLATGSLDHGVKLWEVRTGRLQATLGEPEGAIHDLAIFADGKTLAVLSTKERTEDRTVTLWDLTTQEQRTVLHDRPASRWAFSPDGKTLATANRLDKTLTLWDLRTGEIRGTLVQSIPETVLGLAFSPDGNMLAVDHIGGLVTLWDLSTGRPRSTLQRFGRRAYGIAFSCHGTTLATGHQDGTVRLWDATTGKPIATLDGHLERAVAVAFAADGKSLLTHEIGIPASANARDGAVKVWDLPPEMRRSP